MKHIIGTCVYLVIFLLGLLIIYPNNVIGQNCITKSTKNGNSFPKPCIFPFIYDGKKYFQCTSYGDEENIPWCSTWVDSNGNHGYETGEWGHCDCSIGSCCSNAQNIDFSYYLTGDDDSDPEVDEPREDEDCEGCLKDYDESSLNFNNLLPSKCTGADYDDYPDNYPDDYYTDYDGYPDDYVQPIINGRNASVNQFPFIALTTARKIENGRMVYWCGGSLINQRYVLSVAHCYTRSDYEFVNVILGELNVATNRDCVRGKCAPPVQRIPIENILKHPRFYQSRLGMRNDIALIRMRRNAIYNSNVKPICLPLPNDRLTSSATIMGWGKTHFSRPGDYERKGIYNEHLQYSNVQVKPFNQCRGSLRQIYGSRNIINGRSFICALNPESDSCKGDSGGPMIVNSNRGLLQIGIVSFGMPDCQLGIHSFYTKVSNYRRWIIESLRN